MSYLVFLSQRSCVIIDRKLLEGGKRPLLQGLQQLVPFVMLFLRCRKGLCFQGEATISQEGAFETRSQVENLVIWCVVLVTLEIGCWRQVTLGLGARDLPRLNSGIDRELDSQLLRRCSARSAISELRCFRFDFFNLGSDDRLDIV